MYFSTLACCGIVFNVWLYIDDLRNRDGILDKVDSGENLQELMTTPVDDEKRRRMKDHFNAEDEDEEAEMVGMEEDANMKDELQVYKNDKAVRDSLKRSLARHAAS